MQVGSLFGAGAPGSCDHLKEQLGHCAVAVVWDSIIIMGSFLRSGWQPCFYKLLSLLLELRTAPFSAAVVVRRPHSSGATNAPNATMLNI